MGLIFGSSDDGCTAHHYENYTVDWGASSYKKTVQKTPDGNYVHVLEVRTKRSARCEHDGCTSKDYKTGELKHIPLRAVLSGTSDLDAVDNSLEELLDTDDE